MTRRERFWQEGHRTCHYCRQWLVLDTGHPNTMTVDHKRPRSRGGTSNRLNLAAACSQCNTEKGSLTESEYRMLDIHRMSPTKERVRRYGPQYSPFADALATTP